MVAPLPAVWIGIHASPEDIVAVQLTFDLDVRANVFEMNIRLLGGLLSAHLLAEDAKLGLMPEYQGGLLGLALDLGSRLLPAFTASPSGGGTSQDALVSHHA